MQEIIQVSESLWLDVNVVHPDYDDHLFYIRDDVGGETLIDKAEIPALIVALNKVAERNTYGNTTKERIERSDPVENL